MIKNTPSETETARPSLIVVQHWAEELKRLLPPTN